MVLGGWGSVNLEAFCLHVTQRTPAALNEKGEVDLQQLWSDLDPNCPLVGAAIISTMVFRSHTNNLERGAC